MEDEAAVHRRRMLVVPSSGFSYGPPNPPGIIVPVQSRKDVTKSLMPSYELVDPRLVSRQDFHIITGNRVQTSVDHASRWIYEDRRDAQRILDFIFLGPNSIVRDHWFLKREAFTMLIVVRDPRALMNLVSVNDAAKVLGVASCYIDLDPSRLLDAFRKMIHIVNTHLVSVHHESMGAKRGKVLVTCDSGNVRAPPLVVAYIMSMFAQDMMTAIQFVNVQRFCASFDEETKQAFLTWEGIMKAGAAVAGHSHDYAIAEARAALIEGRANAKRGLDDMMDETGEDEGRAGSDTVGDHERFQGREHAGPFMEFEY